MVGRWSLEPQSEIVCQEQLGVKEFDVNVMSTLHLFWPGRLILLGESSFITTKLSSSNESVMLLPLKSLLKDPQFSWWLLRSSIMTTQGSIDLNELTQSFFWILQVYVYNWKFISQQFNCKELKVIRLCRWVHFA